MPSDSIWYASIEPARAASEEVDLDLDKLAQELISCMDIEDIIELKESLDSLFRLMRMQIH